MRCHVAICVGVLASGMGCAGSPAAEPDWLIIRASEPVLFIVAPVKPSSSRPTDAARCN